MSCIPGIRPLAFDPLLALEDNEVPTVILLAAPRPAILKPIGTRRPAPVLRWILALLLAVPAASRHANAEPALAAFQPDPSASGKLACSGADTMQELVDAWGRELAKRSPRVVISVNRGSKLASDGFRDLLEGRADCATFVREPFPSELDAFRAKFGYAPTFVNVANGSYDTKGGTHAIAIYVNEANPLNRLDLTQLDAIFSSSLRRSALHTVATWGELGLAGEWARRPIHVYGMLKKRVTGDPPGIVNFINHRVLLDGTIREDLREQTDAPGESALQAIVNRVAEDPDAIGYSGFAFSRSGVKQVALGETSAGPFYLGTRNEVRSRTYPLSRQIYLVINRPPGQPAPPAMAEFLRFTLSSEGQAVVAADHMHFLPLTAEQANDAIK